MNQTKPFRVRASTGGLLAAAGIALIAASCGSSAHTSTAAGSGATSTTSGSGGASMAAYTVAAHQVGTVGTVLVNGEGRTLYLLSSERGGKLTCTDANGCTKVWPPVELPAGTTKAEAGSGIDEMHLGTVRSSTGDLYVTYNGWPLYTFSGDSGSGTASGVGITSFGGTWYAVSVSGNPAGGGGGAPATTIPGGGGSGGGYGGGGY